MRAGDKSASNCILFTLTIQILQRSNAPVRVEHQNTKPIVLMSHIRVVFSSPIRILLRLLPGTHQRGHRCAVVPTVPAGRILDGQRPLDLLAVPDWQVSDQQQCDRVHAVCDRFVRADAGPDSVHVLPAGAVRHRLGPDRVRAVSRRAIPIRRRCPELQSVRGRVVRRVRRHGRVFPVRQGHVPDRLGSVRVRALPDRAVSGARALQSTAGIFVCSRL
jgi:hypothetical protein